MKEEIQLGLLCHNAEPEWGMLLQVRPFSISLFSLTLAVGVKAPMGWIGKALGTTLSQKVQRGGREESITPLPSHPLPGSGEGDNRSVCVLALSPYARGIALFVTAEGMPALCLESSGQLLVSSSHKRPLPGAQSGSGAPSREQTNTKTRYQRVRARQDLGPGPKSPSGHTDLLGKIAIEQVITLYGVPQVTTWGTNI